MEEIRILLVESEKSLREIIAVALVRLYKERLLLTVTSDTKEGADALTNGDPNDVVIDVVVINISMRDDFQAILDPMGIKPAMVAYTDREDFREKIFHSTASKSN